MQDLLVLWDAIFADGIAFDLVDYIFVAMLLYIRDLCKLYVYKTPFSALVICITFTLLTKQLQTLSY